MSTMSGVDSSNHTSQSEDKDRANTTMTLHGFMPYIGSEKLPDLSPFVMKVICYCKLTRFPFKFVQDPQFFKSAPRGMVPWMEILDVENKSDTHGNQNEDENQSPNNNDNTKELDKTKESKIISDSSMIIEFLEERLGQNNSLDAGLTLEQRAISTAFIHMIEEAFFFNAFAYTRMASDAGFKVTRHVYFHYLDDEAFSALAAQFRERLKLRCELQGISRKTEEERISWGQKEILAMSNLLGNKQYMLRDEKPSVLDCVVYGFLLNMIEERKHYEFCPLRQFLLKQSNLVNYVERLTEEMKGL